MDNNERISKLFFEAGQLKRLPRSGWSLAGVKNAESVAEHSWRASLIGLVLAKMENVDENKVVKMCLLHDFAETRTGDVNRVNDRYIESKGEAKAFADIFSEIFEGEFVEIFSEREAQKTKEAIVAKDADILEVFIQAKEYRESGAFQSVDNWMKNSKAALKTKSAKELANKLENIDPTSWWHGLKKLQKD
ncbi:MAG: HD domain-containing protein [Candidatus Aenigmarchaeota archaeon]|nr:HD domain-containing protein [Candidatus Aenigmarchaeota archaeon]